MAENGISVESVELKLSSEIGQSSAAMMVDAYLSIPGEDTAEHVDERCSGPGKSHAGAGHAGPEARVFLTKIISRTPQNVIEQICGGDYGSHDFYTVLIAMSIRLGDTATTRMINGMIEIVLPDRMDISDYSPKDKGSITALLENSGVGIALSRNLIFSPSMTADKGKKPDKERKRFSIPVGPKMKLGGTFSEKTGYVLDFPSGELLEYEGMLKSRHEVYWEIYPPMPPNDRDLCGEMMLAVFSLIIHAPKNTPQKFRAVIECRVKGILWGVIPLKGSVDLP